MRQLMAMLHRVFGFLMSHKRWIFIYIPLLLGVAVFIYSALIYASWKGDREAAMLKLSRYKLLIDRTEEIRSGVTITSADADPQAKVVDIPTRIYDRNGEVIGEFFDQKREIVPLSYIPKTLVNAVIASEDREFYQHKGVNPGGIFRAFLVNLSHLQVVQGGSTVTQQLAKVLFTDMERSYKRKVYEIFCAQEIERNYDKSDIITMYLNLIYFGNGSYGVESTAKMYFGKSVRELNEVECAMIVGTISNPLIYSPLNNLPNSLRKTKRILRSLVETKYMTQARADYEYKQFLSRWDFRFNAKNDPESSMIGGFLYSNYRINRAPFFNEVIRLELSKRFGDDVVKKGGLSVYTTIDARKQDLANAALRDGIREQRQYHLSAAAGMKNPERANDEKLKSLNIEGGFVSINPFTGEIISYEGGYSFSVQNQLDHVSKIRRQPGSSFKPLVYCAAFEKKSITPSSVFIDEKTTFEGKYSPQNYDGGYNGEVIVHTALCRSLNIVAVKVLEKTGFSLVSDYIAHGLALEGADAGRRFGKTLSLALGTYEISPLEAAQLHAMLVNGGQFVRPWGLRQVKDYEGNVVWNNEEEEKKFIDSKRAEYGTIVDPAAAAVTVNILKAAMKPGGTGYGAASAYGIDFPVAGKTGTSTDYNDAWFIGYTSDSVSAVWIGNNKGAISLGSGRTGGSVAAPIWTRYAVAAYKGNPPADFTFPEEGVVKQTICLSTGLVPKRKGLCPSVAEDELFIEGTEPGTYCTVHLPAPAPEAKDTGKEGE
jgi:membrane carboxypeptidase/penicillin-binding protein